MNVETGIAGTGVVGTLRNGSSDRALGLRADIDALEIVEANTFAHRSTFEGKMHACGHDGHTAMLLGAAKQLAQVRSFNGTIHFIFQPAEENEGGARVALEQGLFERFPVDAVFALHNRPGLPIGAFGLSSGPVMGSFDIFEVTVTGRGTHAAKPHLGRDPIVAAAGMIGTLQSIVARSADPLDALVVSITKLQAGSTWNMIPTEAIFGDTVHSLSSAAQDLAEERIREITTQVGNAYGCDISLRYERRYPVLVNDPEMTEFCRSVAEECRSAAEAVFDLRPTLGAEDYAFMLERK